MPLKFSEFNITLRLVDSIYVTDQTLVSVNLYVDQVTLHEMEEIQFVKNYNNFDMNISFLENFVIRDSQNITNQEFNIGANNCTNTNDMFLMLIEDDNNTLCLPNKRAKNLQLYIGNQLFQTGIKSDLESYLELKNRSEFFDEFIIDYNRFLNNSVSSGIFYEGANFMINGLPEISIKYFSELASITYCLTKLTLPSLVEFLYKFCSTHVAFRSFILCFQDGYNKALCNDEL